MLSFLHYLANKAFILAGILATFLWIAACSAENKAEQYASTTESAAKSAPATSDKDTGSISTIELNATPDLAMVEQGKTIFESKCASCHKFGENFVGPDLAGVTQRRKHEWIMEMILNPEEMLQKDTTAQELLAQFMTQMPNQNLTQEEARAVLEYFRTK